MTFLSNLPIQAEYFCLHMFFPKSFGYAVRTTLYLAAINHSRPLVRMEEIAQSLDIPRHFLAKILKRLAKEGLLVSVKGPNGGFGSSQHTLQTPLVKILALTGQAEKTDFCLLMQAKCNEEKPCALHKHAARLKNDWVQLLSETTIAVLLKKEQAPIMQLEPLFTSVHD